MSTTLDTYCIDANVLIQAWQKYYSPKFCPDYWNVLDELGKENKIFICEEVYGEIKKTEDDLYETVFAVDDEANADFDLEGEETSEYSEEYLKAEDLVSKEKELEGSQWRSMHIVDTAGIRRQKAVGRAQRIYVAWFGFAIGHAGHGNPWCRKSFGSAATWKYCGGWY